MASIAWPTGLPNFEEPLVNEYEESPGTTTVRTQMDVGPDKVRRRTTAAVDQISVGYMMTKSQVSTFDGFYDSTTNQGALRFDATHPRTGKMHEFRFREAPQISALGGLLFQGKVKVEVLP